MKHIVYVVVGLFILSGFSTLGMGDAGEIQGNLSYSFSEPTVVEKEAYVELNLQGTDSWIFDAGSPMLPRRIETMTLPFGATIQNIVCVASGVQTKVLTKKISPAPQPMRLDGEVAVSSEPAMNPEIYDSTDLFPNDWISYHTGAGLDENNQHKTFLTINTYPIRYEPSSDTIRYASDIKVTVTYTVPDETPFPATTEYKLVIIAPSKFASTLQPLIDHKIAKGISTMLKTTEDIYAEYTTGYDKPEQIKFFIKNALETYNTSYILLVGGLKSRLYAVPKDTVSEGSKGW